LKLFYHKYVVPTKCTRTGKAVSEMTYAVSGGTLNPTHSLASWHDHAKRDTVALVTNCPAEFLRIYYYRYHFWFLLTSLLF